MATSALRKQVDRLIAEDFQHAPVWEFALDEEGLVGQDETTVRPYIFDTQLDPVEGMFVVRARFALRDGTILPGYLTPPVQRSSDLGTLQPVILTLSGQVLFWFGTIAPDSGVISEMYSRLEKSSPTQVFPIKFESAVPLAYGQLQGTIPGFLVLEDFRTMRTRVLT